LNNLRINITIDSLTRLTAVSTNTYHLVARFFNSSGVAISNPNLPNPYVATVTTTTTNFVVNVPITDATYSIPGITLKLFANTNSDCCFGVANFDLNNSPACTLVVDATFIQCNGVLGTNITGLNEPASNISISIPGLTGNLFNERSGNLFTFDAPAGSLHRLDGTYRISLQGADNCTSFDDIALSCAWPTFNLDVSPSTCTGSTINPATVRLFGVTNATHYRICYQPVFSCGGDCTTSDGTVNSSGDTIISITPGTPGVEQYYTIRVYNGMSGACLLYTDYNGRDKTAVCTTPVTCPPDGTWTMNLDGDYYKTTTTASTAVPSGYLVVAKPNKYYAIDGSQLYNSDLTTFTTLSAVPVWKATTATNGPMNRCAVWTDQTDTGFPVNYKPLNMWIGFSKCLTGLTPGKQYYVGLEADNAFRLIVDGEIIFEKLGSDTHFRTWKIIPVVAKKANMLIAMQAINTEYAAGFGCEIYDNTAVAIAAASTVGDLNIIFSSVSKINGKFDIGGLQNGVQYGYGCPDGYTYNPCTNLCEMTQYCTPS